MSEEENVTPNDDNICNEIMDGVQDVVTVTCNYNNSNSLLRGRYVTIRRKDDASNRRELLNFCEVEVLSCRPGFWGKDLANGDCSQSCVRCVEGSCRVLDGYCFTGCQEGYWGDSCENECDCEACNRTTGCPVVGESKQKSQMLILSNSIFAMQDRQICLLRSHDKHCTCVYPKRAVEKFITSFMTESYEGSLFPEISKTVKEITCSRSQRN